MSEGMSMLTRLLLLLILALLLVWNGRVFAQSTDVADGVRAKLRVDESPPSIVGWVDKKQPGVWRK
jgi:hypothetical protein